MSIYMDYFVLQSTLFCSLHYFSKEVADTIGATLLNFYICLIDHRFADVYCYAFRNHNTRPYHPKKEFSQLSQMVFFSF